ncbi:MAG: peptide-methionine (S)-S-oxide reductase, partial [Erysipelotrichaceae bacterium]|nr:peptide-methionine (S)-S-oxide reductase [Erysipelotrichaceae bacterium]
VNTETILHAYFHVVDPTVTNKQGHDIGTQYQAGLYYTDDKTRRIIEYMCNEEKKKTDVFCIEVCELVNFYDAEEYHQKYLVKNPDGYCHITPGKMKTAIETVDSIPDSELYK